MNGQTNSPNEEVRSNSDMRFTIGQSCQHKWLIMSTTTILAVFAALLILRVVIHVSYRVPSSGAGGNHE